MQAIKAGFQPGQNGGRMVGKAPFGLAFAAAILLLLELAVRIILPVPRWKTFYSDMAGPTSLYVHSRELGDPWRETNPAYHIDFHKAGFRTDSSGPRRVFAVGGSVTHGWGLANPATEAFSAVLARRSGTGADGRGVEFINAGGTGWGSTRVLSLVRELLAYKPSCLIVYSGNNEFFEYPAANRFARSRVFRAAGYMERSSRAFCWMGWSMDAIAGLFRSVDPAEGYEDFGDAEADRVVKLFGRNIRSIMAACRSAGVPAVFCAVARNMRVDPEQPGDILGRASRHRGITVPALAEWEREFRWGMASVHEGNWERALGCFRAAAAIDGNYAKLHYWMGRSLERLGRPREAAEEYIKYIDLSRRIATSAINREIVSACREQGFPYADTERAFRAASRDGITGYDLFVDCMHPNTKGHELIAAQVYPHLPGVVRGH